MASQQSIFTSTLEVFDLETGKRTVILRENTHFEAPNWSKDGQYFVINQEGGLYTVSLDGKTKKVLPTGELSRCNNDTPAYHALGSFVLARMVS